MNENVDDDLKFLADSEAINQHIESIEKPSIVESEAIPIHDYNKLSTSPNLRNNILITTPRDTIQTNKPTENVNFDLSELKSPILELNHKPSPRLNHIIESPNPKIQGNISPSEPVPAITISQTSPLITKDHSSLQEISKSPLKTPTHPTNNIIKQEVILSPKEMADQAEKLAFQAKQIKETQKKTKRVSKEFVVEGQLAQDPSKPDFVSLTAIPISDAKGKLQVEKSLSPNPNSYYRKGPSTRGIKFPALLRGQVKVSKENLNLDDQSKTSDDPLRSNPKPISMLPDIFNGKPKISGVRMVNKLNDKRMRRYSSGSMVDSEDETSVASSIAKQEFQIPLLPKSSPLLDRSKPQEDCSLEPKKKRKPLYLRMIAKAKKKEFLEEQSRHEEYIRLKKERAKNNPSRAEIKEHMKKYDEMILEHQKKKQQEVEEKEKQQHEHGARNHVGQIRMLKKIQDELTKEQEEQDNPWIVSPVKMKHKSPKKSVSPSRHSLETNSRDDHISESINKIISEERDETSIDVINEPLQPKEEHTTILSNQPSNDVISQEKVQEIKENNDELEPIQPMLDDILNVSPPKEPSFDFEKLDSLLQQQPEEVVSNDDIKQEDITKEEEEEIQPNKQELEIKEEQETKDIISFVDLPPKQVIIELKLNENISVDLPHFDDHHISNYVAPDWLSMLANQTTSVDGELPLDL